MALNRASIELSIDRIEIAGFGAHNPALLQRALEREVSRLLEVEGLPPALGSSAVVVAHATPLEWDGRGREAGLAAAIAAALFAEPSQ